MDGVPAYVYPACVIVDDADELQKEPIDSFNVTLPERDEVLLNDNVLEYESILI